MDFQNLKEKFMQNADAGVAGEMHQYMKNKFLFYGYHTPARCKIYAENLKLEKKNKKIDWDLLNQAWNDPYREMQYFACDYLIALKKYLMFSDMDKIENFVRTKSWWDTIDSLIKPVGYLGLHDERVNDLMLKWSQDDNIWIRRFAIEHQLLRKDQMNTALLAKIIKNNLNSKEFFINKAIGWALRDYSKTNPHWVKSFINEYSEQLTPLSIKESSKYL
ncbi:DNA alkylation repair protein [Lactobacillus rodentium]|uniref:DNA-7-methylguanine glycosylase n=1 Tax=Lactobacillus rodentium TaxID=947835 RepID=A0A2Z6TEW7_9LACO|nr:DNA alkylation repair protein [Lactobacillus rodentium]MCR1894529.1 DNA alkylation repair protein [Lactobacillus rodentium]GBG04760.1 DNA-7-methylguanine glycosylase [Lactobacillus rodentium]